MATIGFIGLGVMGQPMALNLARSGTRLIVWNRSPEKCAPVRDAGATVASTVAEVFQQADTVFAMFFDRAAMDQVLERGTPRFTSLVAGRTIVNMSSISPEDSQSLERDIREAGGHFVEAPVSGSRIPAESGQLVAMLAGEEAVVETIRPLLAPMCREAVYCGHVGNGLRMKLAVNLFLVVLVNGLAEAVHFADRQGLPRQQLQAVLNAGPMASSVSRGKLAKLIDGDYSPQAAIADAWNSTRLITDAAKRANVSCNLVNVCQGLYAEASALGFGQQDMVAAIRAMEARSAVGEKMVLR